MTKVVISMGLFYSSVILVSSVSVKSDSLLLMQFMTKKGEIFHLKYCQACARQTQRSNYRHHFIHKGHQNHLKHMVPHVFFKISGTALGLF